jgi:hypothetical protein
MEGGKMSDTPRMDLALRKAQEDCTESYLLTEGLKLERKLNALTKERDIESERATHYRDKWQSAEARIKRLEEAGDGLCCGGVNMSWNDRVDNWRKAKEAKP